MKVCVLGASGLVGSELLKQLTEHHLYDEIHLFLRKRITTEHPKITQHIIDFNNVDSWKSLVQGDVLFSAFGTTINKAKTQSNQYKIDFTYQYEVAKAAASNGTKAYVLVSSVGSNEHSHTFYTRIKGELDVAVKQLTFEKISILRPSFLKGNRQKSRFGERIGIGIAHIVCTLPWLKKYRPIDASTVASAMIKAHLTQPDKVKIYESEEVHDLAKV